MKPSERGEIGNIYGINIMHDHDIDSNGVVISRKRCDICSDPEVLEWHQQVLAQARQEARRELGEELKNWLKNVDPSYTGISFQTMFREIDKLIEEE